jgi:hypothetical protein
MNDDDLLNYYIEIGAVEVAGISQDGEFIYKITEKANEIAPELWQAHMDYIDESLMSLYKAGLVNITYNEDLEAIIQLSKEGYEAAKKLGLIDLGE